MKLKSKEYFHSHLSFKHAFVCSSWCTQWTNMHTQSVDVSNRIRSMNSWSLLQSVEDSLNTLMRHLDANVWHISRTHKLLMHAHIHNHSSYLNAKIFTHANTWHGSMCTQKTLMRTNMLHTRLSKGEKSNEFTVGNEKGRLNKKQENHMNHRVYKQVWTNELLFFPRRCRYQLQVGF